MQQCERVYTATAEYRSQPSHITVKDGVVTALIVTPYSYVSRSLELLRAFAEAVSSVVVCKRIDQVKVGKLSRQDLVYGKPGKNWFTTL